MGKKSNLRTQGKYHVILFNFNFNIYSNRKLTDGLFLKCCRQVATEYPDIVFEELIVDNCAMQLTYYTEKFQNAVICTPNLYGSIMTAIGGGLVGGRSLLGGYTVGAEGNRVRIFEQGARYVGLGKFSIFG